MCSPSVGGGVRIEAGVSDSVNGMPTWRMTPRVGCSCSTVIPKATASGEANAVTMSLMGPHGTSAASSAADQTAVPRSRKRAARIGRSSVRRSTRSPFVAKRGSVSSPGSPIAAHRRDHWRSDPTATASAPSAVLNVSYGTMFGCALPSRPGDTSDTNAFWAWLTRLARVAPRSEMSIRWPRPRPGPGPAARPPRSRPTSAARIETAPSIPVTTSLIATPTLVGPPPSTSGAPVIDMSPLAAWMTKS